jgi:protein phosphatase
VQVASRTEVGLVRSRNEDALLVDLEVGLLAVCDGLGGHPAGDVASAVAIEHLAEAAPKAVSSEDDLVAALLSAHDAVVSAAAEDPELTDMATTVVAAALGEGHAWVAHVGDSRAYLLDSEEGLRQVTKDHGMGRYLSQALGLDRDVEPDLVDVSTAPGVRLMLCSDGLSDLLDDSTIGFLLGEGDAAQACDALVDAALGRGGIDNITVVVAVF